MPHELTVTDLDAPQDLASGAPRDESYVALVYFHGIGSPRRHEEISRLTDALDQYSAGLDIGSVGRLRSQKVVFEPSRVDDKDVAYVSLNRVVKRFGTSYRVEGRFRVYEGYWSPYVSGGYSWLVVFLWMASKLINPISVLSHRWRTHQRLKIATLHRLFGRNKDASLTRSYYRLEKFYVEYENWAARRREKDGGFSGFIREIRRSAKTGSDAQGTLIELAKKWRVAFVREQLALILIFLTIIAAGLDAAALVSLSVYHIAGLFVTLPQFQSDIVMFPNLMLFAVALSLPYLFLKARSYLSTILSDVMFWTIQEEKDDRFSRRRDILDGSIKTLAHVLRDPRCKRIVVIGHSLGSAIAYETLLELGRRKKARTGVQMPVELARLDTISHLITLGSPIDWTHYFFELHDSHYHRYNRIRDELKGDTGDMPFRDSGKPATQWTNIFDAADPISTELLSPRGRLQNFRSIQNIQVSSSHLSKPAESHSAYLSATESLRNIFWICIFGRSPRALPERKHADYFDKMIRFVRAFEYVVAVYLVWAVLFLIGIFALKLDGPVFEFLSVFLQIGASAALLGLMAIFAVTKVADQVDPLRVDTEPVDAQAGPRIP